MSFQVVKKVIKLAFNNAKYPDANLREGAEEHAEDGGGGRANMFCCCGHHHGLQLGLPFRGRGLVCAAPRQRDAPKDPGSHNVAC